MTARAALAALALAAPAAADVPGRLSGQVSAGGGWASDVFVGAGAGANGFGEVVPAARLDLALAPAWKLAARGEVSYGSYQPAAFTTFSQSGGLEARWLPGEAWELSLLAGLDHVAFSRGEPLDPGLVALPAVTDASTWRLAPAARLRTAGWELRASAIVARRSADAGGQPVRDRIGTLLASASRPLDRRIDVSFGAKLTRSDSDRPDFAFGAATLSLGAGASVLGTARLEALMQAQRTDFDTGALETLVRLTVSATVPLWERVSLEAAWSFAGNFPSDPARASASRQLVFLGLTARSGSLEW